MDVLIFNPPYVPTMEEEEQAGQETASIAAAWAGGQTGMTATNTLLDAVPVRPYLLEDLTALSPCYSLFCHRPDASTW